MRILLVDDDALIRDSLKIIFELEKDFQTIKTASNGQEALEICQKEKIDIILMDIQMPVMDGVLATKRIKELFPQIKIIMLTTFKDDNYIKQALKNGAESYILKSQAADTIIESVRMTYKGSSVFQKEIVASMATMLKEDSNRNKQNYQLTEREFKVFKLIGAGLSNKEIAAQLYLSEGTIRNQVTVLLEKLGLRDRTQLAIHYVKNFEN